MPSPLYNNQTLADAEAKRKLGVTIERPESSASALPYVEPSPSVDEMLSQAHATLGRAGQFSQGLDDAVSATEKFQQANPDSPSVFDSTATKLGRLGRDILRPIPAAAESAANIGAFLAPEVAIPSQIIMGLGSGKRLVEGGMGRLKEHPIKSALDVGGVALGVRGISQAARSLKALKTAASAAAGVRQGPLSFDSLTPEAQARNVSATNDVEAGFSRTQAGKLNDIPGAGASKNVTVNQPGPLKPEFDVEDVINQLRKVKAAKAEGKALAQDEPSRLGLGTDEEVSGMNSPISDVERHLEEGQRTPFVFPPHIQQWLQQPEQSISSFTQGSTGIDPRMFNSAGGARLNPPVSLEALKRLMGAGL